MKRKLSESHIQVLKTILESICLDDRVIKRSDIFEEFEKQTKSGLELYQFEREVSEVIRANKIPGYQIKLGRGGGIVKTEKVENISVTTSFGKYIGSITISKLTAFLHNLKKE